MRSALLLISLCLAVFAVSASLTIDDEISFLWDAWKAQYDRFYSADEEVFRAAVFAHNFKKVVKFNEENDTPKLALNKFADLTGDEFKIQYASGGLYQYSRNRDNVFVSEPSPVAPLPDSVDWRAKGAVTAVKNQGQCGSCWAFSTTGVVEGFHFIKQGQLISFSEQQIVDCDTSGEDQGCDGGLPYVALQYVAKEGLETEADYPYTGADGTCKYASGKATQVVGGYQFVTANSTDHLKEAVVSMPVSVGIEADQNAFQLYKSGIIKTGCGANLDHAVLVVGYHTVGAIECFIVKNSWGGDWGLDGYVQIWTSGAANHGQGVCGILAEPVIPTAK